MAKNLFSTLELSIIIVAQSLETALLLRTMNHFMKRADFVLFVIISADKYSGLDLARFFAIIAGAFFICADFGICAVESTLFAIMFFFGIAAPAAAAIVLDSQHKNAGTAAALLGALPFAAGSLAAPCIGMGDVAVDFSIVIILGGALSAVLALIARNYQKKYGPSTM